MLNSTANAVSISFTDEFLYDDDRLYASFDVATTSNVVLRSLGYAGGTNAAGEVIADGGFDTLLFLFDAAGSLITSDDNSSGITSAQSGLSRDALLDLSLDAGSYTAVLTRFNNEYVSGDINLDSSWDQIVSGFDGRSTEFALDINIDSLTKPQVSVPEPLSFSLLGLGLAAVLSRRLFASR
ncbi:MAG: hypothetical protein COB04_11685 [Gammaproteobacteria bacterium]|nr:MAG: hypothetical protein COB04_11685 [Gammaproteobacteria bacterium]